MSSDDYDPVPLASEGLRPSATTTRREALQLYRDVLKAAKHFTWKDKDGVLWRDKLVKSARKEFEMAREERDPEIIARLLVGGRDALMQVSDRMLNKARKIVEEEKMGGKGNARNVYDPSKPNNSFAAQDAKFWQQNWQSRHEAWEIRNARDK